MSSFSTTKLISIILFYIGSDSSLTLMSDGNNNISATTFLTDLDEYGDQFQFRFVQLDHLGGFCDCWAVANLKITHNGQENSIK